MEPLRVLNRGLTQSQLCRVNLKGTKQNEGSNQPDFHAGRQRPRSVSRSGKTLCGAAGRHLLFHPPGFLVAIPWLISTSTKRVGTGAESDLPSVLSEPPF